MMRFLSVKILRLQPEKTATIDLPAIGAERLYIIPIAQNLAHPATDGRVAKLKLGGSEYRGLLWIERSLQWLILLNERESLLE